MSLLCLASLLPGFRALLPQLPIVQPPITHLTAIYAQSKNDPKPVQLLCILVSSEFILRLPRGTFAKDTLGEPMFTLQRSGT